MPIKNNSSFNDPHNPLWSSHNPSSSQNLVLFIIKRSSSHYKNFHHMCARKSLLSILFYPYLYLYIWIFNYPSPFGIPQPFDYKIFSTSVLTRKIEINTKYYIKFHHMWIKENRLSGPNQSIHELFPCSSICNYGPEVHWFQYSDCDLMYGQLGLYLRYSWWNDPELVFQQAIVDYSLSHQNLYRFRI